MVKLIGYRRFMTKAKEGKPSKEMVMLFVTEPLEGVDKSLFSGLSCDTVFVSADMCAGIDLVKHVKNGSYIDIRYNKSGFVVSVEFMDKI